MVWIDCSEDWPALKRAAAVRDEQKRGFASSRYWNDNSHFDGLFGEQVYGTHTGQKPNLDLLIQGDGGVDFPDTNVKGCTYWRDPWLKISPEEKMTVSKYVLVALDKTRKRGYVVGYATKEEILRAQLRDWGHGKRYSIPPKSLHPVSRVDLVA